MTTKRMQVSVSQKSSKARHQDQMLDQALKESFPASDPPQITEPAPKSVRAKAARKQSKRRKV
jgi:hypothetical protein